MTFFLKGCDVVKRIIVHFSDMVFRSLLKYEKRPILFYWVLFKTLYVSQAMFHL